MAPKTEENVPLMAVRGKGSGSGMARTIIAVEGMTCGACTAAIEGGFKNVDGVESFTVSLLAERAVAVHDLSKISAEAVAEIIEDRGFGAEILSTDVRTKSSKRTGDTNTQETNLATTMIAVEGMTCGACTAAIEGGLKGVDGIESFTVSLLSERAVAVHDPSKLSADKIAEIIEDRGFGAEVLSTNIKKSTHSTINILAPPLATTTIAVEGMTCGACTAAIDGGFKGVEGLKSFTVSLITERAVAIHDPNVLSAARVAEIIEDRGFGAEIISTDIQEPKEQDSKIDTVVFKIFGLNSVDDATALEDKLRASPGIIDAVVTLSNSRAKVEYSTGIIGIRSLVEIVESQNLNALLADSEDNNAQLESLSKTKEIQGWRNAFRFSVCFSIPVFLISMIIPMFMKFDKHFGAVETIPGLFTGDIMCLFLTIPVQFGVGRRFYKSAYKSLKHGSATMDVLVVLGTSAAFFFSVMGMVISIVASPHTRPSTVFDTCTMLITFITLGRYLENSAKGQTSKSLSRLMSLTPSMATIYVDPSKIGMPFDDKDQNGSSTEEKNIPTELLQINDVVILRPGDKIPADGIVLTGESYVDESMVTGEAMPILKRKGEFLVGGTSNGTGRLDFKVIRAGRDTQLSQIVKLVQEAQTSRAPIQRMADIVAGYFVPSVITLGLVTFIGWMILSHVLANPPAIFMKDSSGGRFMVCLKLCISVIVFACPCALGLSTPTAVMVGTGVGAENGILVKGGAALETATKITQVVLDKTGTLTMGKMSVAIDKQSNVWEGDWRKRLWWLLVGVTESGSEHPVGRAITAAAREKLGLGAEEPLKATVIEFNAVVGRGVESIIQPTDQRDGKHYKVLIGNVKFLNEHSISVPDEAIVLAKGGSSEESGDSEKKKSKGRTFVFIAIEGDYAGLISLSDELKPDACHAVEALRRLGIKVAMVTGDQEATALQVAKEVGIESNMVWAGVSPDEKQQIVKEMKSQGEIVAMVGDGINDSPALATADVGIAMASGTDVAIEAADIVLMRPLSLLDIPAALHLSRTIFSRIKMNLIWACAYNFIGIPFAMGFFLPFGLHLHPMAAGAAMAASSVSVVCSSLLLKFWKRPQWMTVQGMEDEGKNLRQMDTGLSWGPAALLRKFRRRDEGYVPLENVEGV